MTKVIILLITSSLDLLTTEMQVYYENANEFKMGTITIKNVDFFVYESLVI